MTSLSINVFNTGQHMKIVSVLTTMVVIHKSDKGIINTAGFIFKVDIVQCVDISIKHKSLIK